jgi:hypothetical protein
MLVERLQSLPVLQWMASWLWVLPSRLLSARVLSSWVLVSLTYPAKQKTKITTATISHGIIAQLAIDLALRRCMRRNV